MIFDTEVTLRPDDMTIPEPETNEASLQEMFGARIASIEPSAEAASPERETLSTPESAPAAAADVLLPPPARSALQRLLLRGYVMARTHKPEFQQLQVHRLAVEAILQTLGIKLHLNDSYQIAVIANIGTNIGGTDDDASSEVDGDDDDDGVTLVRSTRLKLLHSLVLMVLRIYFRERERALDEVVVIELEAIRDRLKPYWPLLNAEQRSNAHLNSAIKSMVKHGILMSVRGKDDQYEVSPIIVMVLDSARLAILVEEYGRLAGAKSSSTGQASGDAHG